MIHGSFYEYNVATSALFTAQANLQITANNIANAATPGYSRQYGITVANTPMSGGGSGMYGSGSSVTGVERYRNSFLDQKYWSQNCTYSQYSTRSIHTQTVERIFTSIDSDGTHNLLLDSCLGVESTFSDLATNPSDATYRNSLLSSTESMCQNITQIGNALMEEQQSLNEEIVLAVTEINSIADQIARLNDQIQLAEFSGDTANNLRDQRELLIDELSSYVNVEVIETQKNPDYDPSDPYSEPPNYETTILIDGNEFIKGGTVNHLGLVNRDDMDPPKKVNPNDAPGMYDIVFEGSGTEFPMYSSTLDGSLKALIDMRDGNGGRGLSLAGGVDADGEYYGTNEFGEDYYRTTDFKGIPHYIDRLNELVRTYARAVNEGLDHNGDPIAGVIGHVDGYDLDGDTGRFFFTMYDDEGNEITNVNDDVTLIADDGTVTTKKYSELTDEEKEGLYSNLNWNNITVSSELKEDPDLIATSSTADGGVENNDVVLGFSSLMDDPNVFASGTMSDFIIGITTEAAYSAQQSEQFESYYTDIVTVSDNQRIAVSGVDLNEEGANMIKYQQMFVAAAKMISIMDDIYDTTINGLF